MRVGLPKGLLYQNYHPFLIRFFKELGAEVIVSADTNKDTLDAGVRFCVDDACIPIKVFHGHVVQLRDQCDLLVVPRIMSIQDKEYICPKFCGLPEMIINSIPELPPITTKPIYLYSRSRLFDWCIDAAALITSSRSKIGEAFQAGLLDQLKHSTGIDDNGFDRKIALVGHPYNLHDRYLNMNIIKKLKDVGIGVCTEESLDEGLINGEASELYKKPFWTFARRSYGFATHMALTGGVEGIIYLSSFACGIDSIVIELIKSKLPEFPILVLKLDEHSGEAGFNTRVEAFSDMLGRRELSL